LVGSKARRMGWVLAFPIAAHPAFAYYVLYDPSLGTALLQTFLLFKVRKRVWIWVLAILLNYVIFFDSFRNIDLTYDLYVKFSGLLRSALIPSELIPHFYILRFIIEWSLLGAAAAFFMPPINQSLPD